SNPWRGASTARGRRRNDVRIDNAAPWRLGLSVATVSSPVRGAPAATSSRPGVGGHVGDGGFLCIARSRGGACPVWVAVSAAGRGGIVRAGREWRRVRDPFA